MTDEVTPSVEPVETPAVPEVSPELAQLKNDMFKFKEQARAAQVKQVEAESQLEAARNKQLADNENYKQLWEEGQAKLSDAVAKNSEFADLVIKDKKMNAIKQEALKSGIDPVMVSLLDSMDTSSVVVETTDQGNFNVLGAEQWVSTIKDQYKNMFPSKAAPNLNNGVGGTPDVDKVYSGLELVNLQKKDPEAYRKVMAKRTGLN